MEGPKMGEDLRFDPLAVPGCWPGRLRNRPGSTTDE